MVRLYVQLVKNHIAQLRWLPGDLIPGTDLWSEGKIVAIVPIDCGESTIRRAMTAAGVEDVRLGSYLYVTVIVLTSILYCFL